MRRVIMVLGGTLIVAFASVIVGCERKVRFYGSGLAKVQIGDSEELVVSRLDQPSVKELEDRPFLRYATKPCFGQCKARLWWEWPILPGVEAWSVELDAGGRVIDTAHWVSP
jgi:hypothetical protein